MAKRFDTYCGSVHNRSTGRFVHADGEFVLATDYAAIEAERDEWKRRCEALVRHVENADVIDLEWCIAIAEGRDNG